MTATVDRRRVYCATPEERKRAPPRAHGALEGFGLISGPGQV
jgi:hypothetical protein